MRYCFSDLKRFLIGISVLSLVFSFISVLSFSVSVHAQTDTETTTETSDTENQTEQQTVPGASNQESTEAEIVEPASVNGHETEDPGVPEETETETETNDQEDGTRGTLFIFIAGLAITIFFFFFFFKKFILNKP